MPSHIYYLTRVPRVEDQPAIRLLREIRQCMRVLDLKATARDAENCIAACRETGFGYLGVADGEPLEWLAKLREQVGTGVHIQADIDTEKVTRDHRAPTPEEVFADAGKVEMTVFRPAVYETAMTMVSQAGGNPLLAAANALALGRASEQMDLFGDVVKCIDKTFPWVGKMLEAQQREGDPR